MPTRVLVPSGVLGLGFDREALARGVAAKPDIIAIDGGSTDSGPFSLGAGVSKYSRAATKSEWRQLMKARAEAGRCYSCGAPFGKFRTCWFCLPCEVECPQEALWVDIPYLLR